MNCKGLICPVCGSPLSVAENGRGFRCGGVKMHNFDISRSGHVNFAGGGYDPNSGDPVDMVRARIAFLEEGWFEPLARCIGETVGALGGLCVDAGCGNGYYTEWAAERAETVYAFDLSKYAVEYGAKKAKREGKSCLYAVSSVYGLPLASGCADTVLSVFAPVAEEEFCRVLKDGGRLIIAAAAPDHLRELKAQLYESVTENTERGDLPKTMKLIEKNRVSYTRTLHSGAIAALYGMTPYSRRTSREAAERLLGLEGLEITFSFDIYVYGKKEQV
ncbi:MAG: methyltransferase domain-containing protein [Clostridia bacterium]|nr:methyltransferase domain-containing protein [Clostridia bacterium]